MRSNPQSATHSALAKLTAEQNHRLADLDPAWAPLNVPQPEDSDTVIGFDPRSTQPEAPAALAVVRTDVYEADSLAAVWGARAVHSIQLRTGANAETSDISPVIEAAVQEASGRDTVRARGAGSRLGPGEKISDTDRTIRVAIPASEVLAAQALSQAGFRLDSATGMKRRDAASSKVSVVDSRITPPRSSDEDELTYGLIRLHDFDTSFMTGDASEFAAPAKRRYARAEEVFGAQAGNEPR